MKFDVILKSSQKTLKKKLENYLVTCGYTNIINKDGFLYAEGDIPVLLVAHMDTVHRDLVTHICRSSDNNIIMSPQGIGGDDRCGIYAIVEIIKTNKCHVLFTEDEESGCIGARKFTRSGLKPKVNYIIEIDRANGNDAVYYDCDNKDFEKLITKFGFETAWGSFTDISDVAPYLKVAAVNLSSGYYNPHTQYEYIVKSEIDYTIERIKKILREPMCKYEYVARASYYDYYENDTYDNYTTVYANNISELDGYVVCKGAMYDSKDMYIGEDGNVYKECSYGVSICLKSAEAKTFNGNKLEFNAKAISYELITYKAPASLSSTYRKKQSKYY